VNPARTLDEALARTLGRRVTLRGMVASQFRPPARAPIVSLISPVGLDANVLVASDALPSIVYFEGARLRSDRPGLGVAAA
jgi:hypothetical protein